MKRKLFITLLLVSLLSFNFVFPVYAADGEVDLEYAINTIWVLMAAFLVFIMHAGFAMVETGFTRAKNAVNIIMKNLITIATGTITFFFVGFALMFGKDLAGFIGFSNFALIGTESMDFGIPTIGFWFFQAVFAATCATIVSGAVAERIKFTSYWLFTIIITAFTYPIVGHWIWGGGWLAQKGFIDLAGSTVVHSVGGWSALIGAWLLGPRIGKYTGEKIGVIPGHNIPLGALGVFLLFFGWFGFNPGSTLSGLTPDIALIASTTLLAGCSGTITAALLTWTKYSKPDLSLSLNGALAGLVAITAGAQVVSPLGSIIIGAIAGVILVFSVEFFDKKVKIDDPVGAISVHGVCGSFGTLAIGCLAINGGLFYGGGIDLLIIQSIGVISVFVWSISTSYLVFKVLDKLTGIRVSSEEEIEGLDISEHAIGAYDLTFSTQSSNIAFAGNIIDKDILAPSNKKSKKFPKTHPIVN